MCTYLTLYMNIFSNIYTMAGNSQKDIMTKRPKNRKTKNQKDRKTESQNDDIKTERRTESLIEEF